MSELGATAVHGKFGAGPLEAVAHALDVIGEKAFTPDRRELGARVAEIAGIRLL